MKTPHLILGGLLRNHRGIVTILLGAALLATAATVVFLRRLPDPTVANRDQLLQWLVTRDLGRESDKTRAVLARRLDEEFRKGIDWKATAERLSSNQEKQVWENVPLLLAPWLEQKTERYFALAEGNRSQFVDKVIDSFQVWRGVELMRPKGEESTRGGLMKMLLEQAEQCKASANPAQREQTEQFLSALQTRWVMRTLGGMFESRG